MGTPAVQSPPLSYGDSCRPCNTALPPSPRDERALGPPPAPDARRPTTGDVDVGAADDDDSGGGDGDSVQRTEKSLKT